MQESWIVTVDGQAYGPYPIDQMRAFIAEGRVLPHSLVGPDGAPPHQAAIDPLLGPLFAMEPVPDEAPAPGGTIAAEPDDESAPAQKFGRHDDAPDHRLSHFVIVADMKSRAINGLEEEIFNLGSAYPVLPQVWLLVTDQSVNAVRNILVQKLGKLDTLFVVDCTHDKAAWFNFGPEADSRMRRVWSKPTEIMRKSA